MAWIRAWIAEATQPASGVVRVPGVLVSIRGRSSLDIAAGFANMDAKTPMSERSTLALCSLVKPVLALAILRMLTIRGIGLDARVRSLCGGWWFRPDQSRGFDADAITFRDLLAHRSGLHVHAYGVLDRGVPMPSASELMDGAMGEHTIARLEASPGSRSRYSAAGYTLLQLILEASTGVEMGPWIRCHLLEPLGIQRLGFAPLPSLRRDLCAHYVPRTDGSGMRRCRIVRYASRAGTGLWGSPVELADLISACMRRDLGPAGAGLIDPSLIDQVLIDHRVDGSEEKIRWGLGVVLDDHAGIRGFSHGGWKQGWCTLLRSIPDAGITIVASGNSSAFHPWARRIAFQASSALVGRGALATAVAPGP
ncbi:MAG: beta-lactamase family protein [Phycisphaeraceae bacterium]|nr:beta-lactamase family protein [Phycisphaeraceae bacterium]